MIGDFTYVLQAVVALWGTYCMVTFMRGILQLSFRNESQQDAFLDGVEKLLQQNRVTDAEDICEGDSRALPRLMFMGLRNRSHGLAQVTKRINTRLHRDVLSNFHRRARWIGHCIKIAPMLGLFGTVLGMMGAFSQLATAETVAPAELAKNISLALITTAVGLSTAMPLMFALQKANERLIEFQDLMELGLSRFREIAGPLFPAAVPNAPKHTITPPPAAKRATTAAV
jgi:biopolymer transport protein ExbB/TolQ